MTNERLNPYGGGLTLALHLAAWPGNCHAACSSLRQPHLQPLQQAHVLHCAGSAAQHSQTPFSLTMGHPLGHRAHSLAAPQRMKNPPAAHGRCARASPCNLIRWSPDQLRVGSTDISQRRIVLERSRCCKHAGTLIHALAATLLSLPNEALLMLASACSLGHISKTSGSRPEAILALPHPAPPIAGPFSPRAPASAPSCSSTCSRMTSAACLLSIAL